MLNVGKIRVVLSIISSRLLLIIFLFFCTTQVKSQTTKTIASGAFIIDMGVLPQTISNGLKPYGMLYDLLKNYQIPIIWSIRSGKTKDAVDFTIGTKSFMGGPFIIEAGFRTAAVNTAIASWQSQGVVGVTTTAPVTVPVYTTILSAPKWTLDQTSGSIAVPYFTNANIPSTAYGGSSSSGWKTPSQLNSCDGIFILPHADPTWAVHGSLLNWNLNSSGSIWQGCHSGSALTDMFNPANVAQQTNFLAEKTGNASGSGPYFENALLLWGNHAKATIPYTYENADDPIMQFMGILDGAVTGGSENIFIPKAPGWRSTTKVPIYQPGHANIIDNQYIHRAASVAWGRGFGDNNRGYVMMQGSHQFASTTPEYIAAQRLFFNFSFFSSIGKTVTPSISGLTPGANLYSGQSTPLSVSIPSGTDLTGYTIQWTSSCGGTFSPSATAQNVTFTPPLSVNPCNCQIGVALSDACGRTYFNSSAVVVQCAMTVSSAITDICFGGSATSGAINMTIASATAPYNWTWTKTGGGTGSGTGTSITGLTAGTYSVTVQSNGGTGCSNTFTAVVNQLSQISITATPSNASCFGGSNGSISVTVAGGSPGYTYNWGGGILTPNRSGLIPGTYNLTVTDSKSCTATASPVVTQPTAIAVSSSFSNVSCNGQSTGAINLIVSGGTSPYTHLWNDGITTQNRSGILAGTYSDTIRDANGCKQTSGIITVTQPSAALSLNTTPVNVTCASGTTGSISLTVSGGTTAYAYAWTKSGTPGFTANTQNISSLSAGTYNVTVTDSKSCTATRSAVVTQPSTLTLSSVITNPTCPPDASSNNSDGAIALTVSGGTASYTYAWSGPNGFTATSQNLTSRIAGSYTVIVTDAKNCTATSTIILNYLNPKPKQPTSIKH